MGRWLFTEEPAFRDALTECDRAMGRPFGGSVIAEILADGGRARLDDVGVIQPVIFAVQVALSALWREWGVEPRAVVGHSLGEVAAAHVAGALTLEDAAQVICARAALLRRVAGRGAMVAAEISLAEAQEIVAGRPEAVAVAAENSHRSTVLSGDPTALTDIVANLERRGRFCRWISVDVASHSPQMTALRGELGEMLTGLSPVPPRIPMYSTVTGGAVSRHLDNAYWADNLCRTVRFSSTVRDVLATGADLFCEVSPHPLLLSAIREDAEDMGRQPTLLPSMRRDDGDHTTMLGAVGALYARGHDIAWNRLHPWGGTVTALPRYPWQRRRCWLDGDTATGDRTSPNRAPGRRPIRSAVDPNTVFYEFDVTTDSMPILADHRVQGAVILPAAAVLEFVTTALTEAFGAGPRLLRDVAFHHSVAMASGRPCTVQIVLRGQADEPVLFECYRLDEEAAPAARWSLFASGVAQPEEALDGGAHDLDAIRSRCPEEITAARFYDTLAGYGLDYGPGLRAVAAVHRGGREALASLKPAAAQVSSPESAFRTIDACFQTLAATLPMRNGHQDRATYLPVAVSEVAAFGPTCAGTWCHAVLTEADDAPPGALCGDVFLLDDDGRVAMAVRGLRAHPVGAGAQAAGIDDKLYEPGWQVRNAKPADRQDHGTWLFFSDGADTTGVLRRHLDRHTRVGVFVEPGPEFARVGRDEFRIDPDQPQHYRRLVDELSADDRAPATAVVHLWSLAAEPCSTAESLAAAQRLGPSSVLHLVQALVSAAMPRTPRLYLVTRGAHRVSDDDGPVAISGAPLWGMGRSIDQESPELRCKRIDLSATSAIDQIGVLIDEMLGDDDDTDVALRDSGRHVARLRRYDPVAAGTPTPPSEEVSGDQAYRMEYLRPGVLDDVRARSDRRRPPGNGEIEIRVHAAGLNFIDVLKALGSYPGQGGEPVRIGVEVAGTVTAVGPHVHTVRVGDAVLGLASDGLGSHVTTAAALVVAKPARLSFEEAATIPIAFLTAYYALHEQARLRIGERVLIHSAAGGVGLAAIEVARWLGASVHATAGTAAKRDHLRGLGVEYVSDSRSLDFAADIMAATGGAGVDVVLNSLTGRAVEKGLTALAPYGRFVEIGKRDIYQHGRLRLWQLRRNASYIVVDLAQLADDRPDYIGAMLRDIIAHIEQGTLRLPPLHTFPVSETAEAVRCLARGTHIGKVAVSVAGSAPPQAAAGHPVEIVSTATYLITGGCGGLGLEVAHWLIDEGARHLVLTSRGPGPEPARARMDAWRSQGADVTHMQADAADAVAMADVLRTIAETMPPLRGIVHAAGVLDDGILASLDDTRLREVMAPKVAGGWNLHRLTRDAPLDFFWFFSSAASVFGSPGQAHYAAGNAFLDALAWRRRMEGRPALSINWGPWATVGLVAAAEQIRHLEHRGVHPLAPAEAARAFARFLACPTAQLAVIDVDWPKWLSASPIPSAASSLVADLSATPGDAPAERGVVPYLARLRDAVPATRRTILVEYLREQTAAKLGIAPAGLDIDVALDRLGLDSLIATELRTQMERELGIPVPIVELLKGPSVTDLAERLCERIPDDEAQFTPSDLTDSRHHTANDGASARWLEVLTTVTEASDDTVDALLRTALATREGDSHDRHR